MLFAHYAQRLKKRVEPLTQRGKFTEKVLKLIVNNEGLLHYSSSSYKCFYDGKKEGEKGNTKIVGDAINRCAQIIKNNLDASEFTEYLSGLDSDIKANLCKEFKSEVPDINIDNCPEKLSQLLIDIIKKAATETKSVSANDNASNPADSKPISANNVHNGTKMYNERTIEAVRAIVVELNELIHDLDNDSMGYGLFSNITTDEQKAEESKLLRELQRKFWCKNNELLLYRSSISEIGGLIAHAVELSNQLSFQPMVQFNKDSSPIVVADGLIDDYEDYLEEIMSILSTL